MRGRDPDALLKPDQFRDAGQDGVVDADKVAGPYDTIVRAESRSLDDLGKLVVSEMQRVDGMTRTFTCRIVNP